VNGSLFQYSTATSSWTTVSAPTVVGQILEWNGGAWVQNSTTAPSNGNTLIWNSSVSKWVPGNITLAGDVTGSYNSNKVVKIQGISVSSTAPYNAQLLISDGTTWNPTTMVGDVSITNTGNTYVSGILGTNFSNTPTTGQYLSYVSGTPGSYAWQTSSVSLQNSIGIQIQQITGPASGYSSEVTCTTAFPHGFYAGQYITIINNTPWSYGGSNYDYNNPLILVQQVPSSTTFNFTASTPVNTGTGLGGIAYAYQGPVVASGNNTGTYTPSTNLSNITSSSASPWFATTADTLGNSGSIKCGFYKNFLVTVHAGQSSAPSTATGINFVVQCPDGSFHQFAGGYVPASQYVAFGGSTQFQLPVISAGTSPYSGAFYLFAYRTTQNVTTNAFNMTYGSMTVTALS
jgi:hypothetical protein